MSAACAILSCRTPRPGSGATVTSWTHRPTSTLWDPGVYYSRTALPSGPRRCRVRHRSSTGSYLKSIGMRLNSALLNPVHDRNRSQVFLLARHVSSNMTTPRNETREVFGAAALYGLAGSRTHGVGGGSGLAPKKLPFQRQVPELKIRKRTWLHKVVPPAKNSEIPS